MNKNYVLVFFKVLLGSPLRMLFAIITARFVKAYHFGKPSDLEIVIKMMSYCKVFIRPFMLFTL